MSLPSDTDSERTAAPTNPRRPVDFDDWFRRFDPDHGHIERLMFLSDGVFAIALTLLALEIRPPEHWDGQIVSLKHDLLAPILSYAIGFMILGAAWTNQRRALAVLERIDGRATTLALIFLACAGLAPAAVSFQIRYSTNPASFVIYGGAIMALTISASAFWGYVAILRPLVRQDLSARYRYGHFLAQLMGIVALAFAIAAFSPGVGPPSTERVQIKWLAGAAVSALISFGFRYWHRRPWPEA